ncbi:MAG: paraquat-inducible protein A [Pseudomonadota bacterium]
MDALIGCHLCGALHRRVALRPGHRACCTRCGATLFRERLRPLSRGIALLLAALVFWVTTHVTPLLTLNIEGIDETATLLRGVTAIADTGLWPLALAVLVFASLAPLVKIVLALTGAVGAALGTRRPLVRRAFALGQRQAPWAMLEIYLFGLIVAYVKLVEYARIEFHIGLLALAATIFCIVAADAVLEPEAVWSRIGRRVEPAPDAAVACHTCHWVAPRAARTCPRCGAAMHHRKPEPLQRMWALLAAAVVLYVPANVYPIMVISQFGNDHPATIIGGVIDLLHAGMYPIAAVVFVASVLVPVAKMLGLAWLAIAQQRRSPASLRSRTKAYAAIEFVGRWSMVDVFMVAILTSLVQATGLFVIVPGIGAIAFGSVVILTMLASMSFDPRMPWDVAERQHG